MNTSEMNGRLAKAYKDLDNLKSVTDKTIMSVTNLLETLNGKLDNDKESKQIVTAITSHIEYLKGFSNG
jgi:hypothetical protein